MQDFKARNRIKKRMYSKFIIFILVVILIFIVKGAYGVYEKVQTSEAKLEVSEENLQKLSEREDTISEQIGRLKTETGMEEEIRSKYNVSKEGERAIVIIEGDEPLIIQEEPKGFVQKIKSWFKE